MTQESKMFGIGDSDAQREAMKVAGLIGDLTELAQDFQGGAHIYMRCRDALDHRQMRDDEQYSDARPLDEKASGAHGVYR